MCLCPCVHMQMRLQMLECTLGAGESGVRGAAAGCSPERDALGDRAELLSETELNAWRICCLSVRQLCCASLTNSGLSWIEMVDEGVRLTCLGGRVSCYLLKCSFYGCPRNPRISRAGNRGGRSMRRANGASSLTLGRGIRDVPEP